MHKEYYMQDIRSVVGNCAMFWRLGGGYTCNVDDAEVFTAEDAIRIASSRETDVMRPKSVIDAIARRHVDVQDLRKL